MFFRFNFSIPTTKANDLPLWRIFYPRKYPLHLFSYLNSWGERASFFPFKCSVLNKGTTGNILITSLVWRGPWLGIEPGTSHTRCQHSTTRLYPGPPTLEASTIPLGYRGGGPWLGIEPGPPVLEASTLPLGYTRDLPYSKPALYH